MIQQISSPGAEVMAANDESPRSRARRQRGEQTAYDLSNSPAPEPDVEDEDQSQFLPVRTLRTQYLDFHYSKIDEIQESKQARHQYHCAQWTPEQIQVLRRRHQPPMTWNRINRKIAGIVGLIERYRTDPKPLPRSPKAEPGAEIAAQAIRYVCDANEFKMTDSWCILQAAIDGIAGVQLVLSQGDTGDPDIQLPWVIGDEYFYDPKSYRMDFADVRYEGISKWLDIDAAIEMFPDKEELLRGLVEGDSDLTTNADREYKWVISATKRVRLVEHWYRRRNNWAWSFYVSTVLLDQGLSPFFDEYGKRTRSFRMFSAAVDHDGDRYGFVRNLKGPQDALNQGKSRTMHIANSRRLILEKGGVDDVEVARREWARADGVVEINPGKNVKPDDTKQELAAYMQFTADAAAEIDSFANVNVMTAMAGQGVRDIPARAVELLRQPGMAELAPFLLSYRAWKLQLYRAIWNAVQRNWTAERWLRVSNNQGMAQFIQLNGLGLDQFGRPAIVNAVGAVDVDIILEEGPDIGTLMQETFDLLKGYPPGTFPAQVLIEMSGLPRSEKDRILKLMQPPQRPPPSPEQQLVQRIQLEGLAADLAQKGANVRKTHAQSEQALATAQEKRDAVGLAQVDDSLQAREFSRDTLMQALELEQKFRQAAQAAKPGAAPSPQAPAPLSPAVAPQR